MVKKNKEKITGIKKEIKEKRKKTSSLVKKPFLIAGIAGIIILITILIGSWLFILQFKDIVGSQNYSSFEVSSSFLFFYNLLSLISMVAFVFFMYGFIILGKKFDNKMLRILAQILMIITLIFVIFSVVNMFFSNFSTATAQELGEGENLFLDQEIDEGIGNGLVILISILLILGFIIYFVLFGISLLLFKNKVELAKPAGILNILGGATFFIYGLGYLFLIVGIIVEIAMFFKLSKKFERQG